MITLREISDSNSNISSTRWAFASVIIFDIIIVALIVIAALVAHFIPGVPDFDNAFYGSMAMLLGILTGLVTTSKSLQGFEPHKQDQKESINGTNDDKKQ